MSIWIVMLNGWPVAVYRDEAKARARAATIAGAEVCPCEVTD